MPELPGTITLTFCFSRPPERPGAPELERGSDWLCSDSCVVFVDGIPHTAVLLREQLPDEAILVLHGTKSVE
jgi:hypothetical protein